MKKNILIQAILLLIVVRGGVSQNVSVFDEKFQSFYKTSLRCLKSDIDSAYTYALKASGVAETKKQKYQASYILGYISNSKKQFAKSNLYYGQALSFASESQANDLKSNISDNLFEMGSFSKALVYAKEALGYSRKINDQYIYYTYGVIGRIYAKKKKLDSAQFYFRKAISLIPSGHDKDGSVIAGFLRVQGDMYREAGLVGFALRNYKQALGFEKNKRSRCEFLLKLAEVFASEKNYVVADSCLNEAHKLQVSDPFCQVRFLQLKGRLQFNDRDFAGIKETYRLLDSVLITNKESLIEKDLSFYLAVKNESQKRVLDLFDRMQNEASFKGRLLSVLYTLCGVFVLFSLFWRKLRVLFIGKQTDYQQAKPLSVVYKGQIEEKKPNDILTSLEKKSRFWSD